MFYELNEIIFFKMICTPVLQVPSFCSFSSVQNRVLSTSVFRSYVNTRACFFYSSSFRLQLSSKLGNILQIFLQVYIFKKTFLQFSVFNIFCYFFLTILNDFLSVSKLVAKSLQQFSAFFHLFKMISRIRFFEFLTHKNASE